MLNYLSIEKSKKMVNKRQQFENFYREYREKLFNVAYRIVGNNEDAIDIVQESFIKAYQKWDSFRGESKFYTWIYRIVINLSFDIIRKRKKEKVMEITESVIGTGKIIDSEKNLILKDIRKEIQKEIEESLTPKQKTVFVLKTYEELPYKEIARILRLKEGTVKAIYFQTIEKLRKKLKEKEVIKNAMQEI